MVKKTEDTSPLCHFSHIPAFAVVAGDEKPEKERRAQDRADNTDWHALALRQKMPRRLRERQERAAQNRRPDEHALRARPNLTTHRVRNDESDEADCARERNRDRRRE